MTPILLVLILVTSATTQITRAETTQTPSENQWLTKEEASGIFNTPLLTYTITNGTQSPLCPEIHLYSGKDDLLKINCLADFRLVKIGNMNTTIDYYREQVHSITKSNGLFWASAVTEPNATYRFGVVLWNTTTGNRIGGLISTIRCVSRSPPIAYVTLSVDKPLYSPSDTVHLTLGYHTNTKRVQWGTLNSILTGEGALLEYNIGEEWVPINNGEEVIAIGYMLKFNSSKTWDIHLSRYVLPINGQYRLVKRYDPGGSIGVDFWVSGVISSPHVVLSPLQMVGLYLFWVSLAGLVLLAIYSRYFRKTNPSK
jgi:hypothetical protein